MDPVLVTAGSDGITSVTLNRPDALNAFDYRMTCALAEALRAIRADRGCRVVLLTGNGRAFPPAMTWRTTETTGKRRTG